VRYFKPLTMQSGTARCEGEVINTGRTTITAQGRLFDASGRLCGHATSTLALISPVMSR
jgi:acyl-coenzyme A thioesterase PaaI-like protein